MRQILTSGGFVAVLKNGIIRYTDRDIVMVLIEGKRQPFYRSSGRNSGMPDTWLPFDGILYPNTVCEWFDKKAYTINPECPWDKYGFGLLHRFGSKQLLEISNELGKMNLPQGQQVETGRDVNLFLGVVDKYEPNYNQKRRYHVSIY